MSQLTIEQSYLLCWELLPDRNCKSTGLWYWELMSDPDPVVLPVGKLHSLEWFWESRRIFVYSHHNTFVFFSEMSICPSVDRVVSALYQLQYLPNPFHIYTPYQATSEGVSCVWIFFFSKLKKNWSFGKFFKFVTLTLSCWFWLGIQYELANSMGLGSMNWSIVGVIMEQPGVSSKRRHFSCSKKVF